MPRTITVFSGSPRDFCEGGMHNGAQCFHCWSKLRSHKHETNNTKASTTHGILIEGHFILDHNSKEWDSGGPHISHIYHISHILHTTKIEGTTHTKQLVNGLIFRKKSEKTLEDCPKKVYFWGEAHSGHSLYVYNIFTKRAHLPFPIVACGAASGPPYLQALTINYDSTQR